MLFGIDGVLGVREMYAYNFFLLLLWLLFGLAQRWPGPVTNLSVVDQLSRRINRLENSKRKLRRQMADCRNRAMLLKKQQEAQQQARLDSGHQPCMKKPSRAQEALPNRDELLQLLDFSRAMVLNILSGVIGFAERRNAAVSRLFSELLGENDGHIVSQLTDPWKRWTETLATHRNKVDQALTQCLERTKNNKAGFGELALPTEPQDHLAPELEAGFDHVLDLLYLTLSSRPSRPESAAHLKSPRRDDSKVCSTVALRGGAGDGPSPGKVVHKPGCPRLERARQLHLRWLRMAEEKAARGENRNGV